MEKVQLGTTGEELGAMALGCMPMGTRTPRADAFRMLDAFVDAGGTLLDTADCYSWWDGPPGSSGGESETVLGEWLRRSGRADDVFVATKGSAAPRDITARDADGIDWSRVSFVGAGAETMRRSLDASLRRLGRDHVDLYYVHIDDWSTPLEETLAALDEIVRSGKARHLGWSNVRTWRLEAIRQLCLRYGWHEPIVVQQQHSYLRRRPGLVNTAIVDDEQSEYLSSRPELTLVSYSPILRGCYDDPARRVDHEAMNAYRGSDADARLAVLEKVADELGAAPSQVVLAWLMRGGGGLSCIPLAGPRTPEQLDSCLAATGLELSAEQMNRLTAAGG